MIFQLKKETLKMRILFDSGLVKSKEVFCKHFAFSRWIRTLRVRHTQHAESDDVQHWRILRACQHNVGCLQPHPDSTT